MAVEISIDPKFVASTLELEAVEGQRVWAAVTQYSKDPTSPGLNLEQLLNAFAITFEGRLF